MTENTAQLEAGEGRLRDEWLVVISAAGVIMEAEGVW